jgi:nitrite reductase/ring-hydroxylating ferredoxin subunit
MLKILHPNASADCLRCPHRGASLEGYPISVDGKITCPMHGLKVKVR